MLQRHIIRTPKKVDIFKSEVTDEEGTQYQIIFKVEDESNYHILGFRTKEDRDEDFIIQLQGRINYLHLSLTNKK